MTKILFFDKGGRNKRKKLITQGKAPRDFLQGLDFLAENGYDIEHYSSSKKYKESLFFKFGRWIEQFFSLISNIGIRPLSVFQFRKKINNASYVVSLTDGFSISLGFYYCFINRKSKIKLAGGFHKLSDYDKNVSLIIRYIYYWIIKLSLKRLNYIIFYGEADRKNSIKIFGLKKENTYIIKFGVDTYFWEPIHKKTFDSNYLFSIGQDPARDFNTLLKVNSKKKIHIHTSLLEEINNKRLKITNGTYYKYKNNFTDLKIKKLYQESFAVLVPIKNVYQPSGYSVTLQAMACGKPVILTITKGLWAPNLFKHKENCLLVNPYDPKEFEEAISFLENNIDLYENICLEARKTVINHFSLDIANKSTLEIFKNFI